MHLLATVTLIIVMNHAPAVIDVPIGYVEELRDVENAPPDQWMGAPLDTHWVIHRRTKRK